MKQAQFTIGFKTVTINGEKVKRDPLVLNYSEFSADDVARFDQSHIAVILNNTRQDFARKLVTANSDNWNYVPDENDFSIESIYSDLTSPSKRGQRLITKAKLVEFSEYYQSVAVSILGKSVKAASNGATAIIGKFVPLIGSNTAIEAFEDNLVKLIESDEFDTDTYGEIVSALIDILTELKKPMELTEDDI